jgi:predicted signal transduction protein with EAL and GGDEF domain
MGERLVVDDFGTGHSSLAYLQRLPIDEIKVDRSFVTNLASAPADAVIVHSTIDLAHNLGLTVVAEGVEDQTALDMLIEYGCDSAQGYLISRPCPPEDLTGWLRESSFGAHAAAAQPADARRRRPPAAQPLYSPLPPRATTHLRAGSSTHAVRQSVEMLQRAA